MRTTNELLRALPSASDTYPELSSVSQGFGCRRAEDAGDQAGLALEEIDILRRVLVVATAWDHARYAMHGNTAEASRLHYFDVREAEAALHAELSRIIDLTVGDLTVRGVRVALQRDVGA